MASLSVAQPFGSAIDASEVAADVATQAELDAVSVAVDGRYGIVVQLAAGARAAEVTGAATYGFTTTGLASGLATNANWHHVYFDPARYQASGRTGKLRLVAGCLVNDAAPAVTLTLGLYPISAVAGAVNFNTPTLGTVVSGSTTAFATPAANSMTAEQSSGDFNMPTAGFYMVGVVSSGAFAASSYVRLPWRLEYRNV